MIEVKALKSATGKWGRIQRGKTSSLPDEIAFDLIKHGIAIRADITTKKPLAEVIKLNKPKPNKPKPTDKGAIIKILRGKGIKCDKRFGLAKLQKMLDES